MKFRNVEFYALSLSHRCFGAPSKKKITRDEEFSPDESSKPLSHRLSIPLSRCLSLSHSLPLSGTHKPTI